MNILFGTLLLVYLLAFCAYCFLVVVEECRFQMAAAEHEELLDALWGDEVSYTSSQIDWPVAISWLGALAFCFACWYVLVRLVEWATA